LIVDDDPINLKVMQGILKEPGYRLLVAKNGERALYQVEQQLPDLILLDVLMPGLDGFETCQQLKLNPDSANLPVIFMTALYDIESKVRGFEVGGVDYITKPFHRAEVLARVKTHLRIHQLQQELEARNAELQATVTRLEQVTSVITHK
jgi:DNA-binding response OmpR family regulator